MKIPNDFFLGCNYWASNAGTEMWRNFDEDAIKDDFKILSSHGLKYLRVFPNWRDFQPVEPFLGIAATLTEYRMTDGSLPSNPYYLDETMLARFEKFCDLAGEYGFKLIVGLVTGWMSGRTFIPAALFGKDLYTDPVALHFEQLLVTGLVERFKHHPAIYAWDHGNECGCIGHASSHYVAANWTRIISNAVYASDRTRPMISGIHQMNPDGVWRPDEQAAVCDMMVTHPYPFWGTHTTNDTNSYIKTSLFATAEAKLFADLCHKPCLVEEVGTMGPSVCSEELAPATLRVNYFSTLANGGFGILWWCANEQTHLMTPPYTWTMVENELGMIYPNREPKPVLKEMKRLSELNFDFDLPAANVDAVCLISGGQDTWGVAFMTYILAKQVGLNISFANANKEIPDADVYLLPSIKGNNIMPKENYLALKQKVANGAKLYISEDTGFLSEFEALTGNKILDSEQTWGSGTLELNGKSIQYVQHRKLYLERTRAEAVKSDLITRAEFGKGEVWFVNIPVESMLIDKNRAFDNDVEEIYREIFKPELDKHIVKTDNKNVAVTIHEAGDKVYVIAVNHSESTQKINLMSDMKLVKVHYGDMAACKAFDAVIVEYAK